MLTQEHTDRLGLLFHLPPMALMAGTTPRIVGPIDATEYDALVWNVTTMLNRFGTPITVELQRSADGMTWHSGEPPVTQTISGQGDRVILRTTRDEDAPGDTRYLRLIIAGAFAEAWHHVSIEANAYYV